MTKKLIALILVLFVFVFIIFYLSKRDYVISSFSTSLINRDAIQLQNITTAAEKINNIALKAGEIFSFNGAVGERTSANYGKSKTIVGQKLEDALGGGLCQLSSTLYNAALRANLKIIERHPHNIVVHSVGPGLDATISYGFYDLKFQNIYNFPVKITAKITGSRLIVGLVGTGRDLSLQINILVENIPSYDKRTIHTRTWRETVAPDGAKSRELISEDVYNN